MSDLPTLVDTVFSSPPADRERRNQLDCRLHLMGAGQLRRIVYYLSVTPAELDRLEQAINAAERAGGAEL